MRFHVPHPAVVGSQIVVGRADQPELALDRMRIARELSGLCNDRGDVELPLTITGMLDNPAIGVDLTSIIGRSLKEELCRRLRRLLDQEFAN